MSVFAAVVGIFAGFFLGTWMAHKELRYWIDKKEEYHSLYWEQLDHRQRLERKLASLRTVLELDED